MKKKVLLIGGVATAVVLAGGWALAQSHSHGPGGFGPPFMQGEGPGGMGPDMMQHMARGMGPGMMQHMGPGMGPGMMRGTSGPTFADPMQIDALKTELGITPAQEPAWSKYARAVQDAATTMKTTRGDVDPDAVSKMTPADRFAFVSKMRDQGQKQAETVKTAADELVAALDDGQKAKAKNVLPGLAPVGPGLMHGAFMGSPHQRYEDR
jgi:hypothetical protein